MHFKTSETMKNVNIHENLKINISYEKRFSNFDNISTRIILILFKISKYILLNTFSKYNLE